MHIFNIFMFSLVVRVQTDKQSACGMISSVRIFAHNITTDQTKYKKSLFPCRNADIV